LFIQYVFLGKKLLDILFYLGIKYKKHFKSIDLVLIVFKAYLKSKFILDWAFCIPLKKRLTVGIKKDYF